MKLNDLIKRLNAKRIVSTSIFGTKDYKDRASIEYSIILTVKEYEELEKEAQEMEKQDK